MAPQTVLDAIAEHARSESPRECCGLLIGAANRILEAVPAVNSAADPARRYLIAPEEIIAQIRRCRSAGDGRAVIGAYHSHPKSAPEPSETDLAEAFQDFLFVIAGPVRAGMPIHIHAYTLAGAAMQAVGLVAL